MSIYTIGSGPLDFIFIYLFIRIRDILIMLTAFKSFFFSQFSLVVVIVFLLVEFCYNFINKLIDFNS